MRQTRANYLHCQAQPEEWAFLSFWRKGNGRVMNWLVFVLFKIWKEVWWWWLQVSIAFRPFHLPVLSFFSPENVLNIFPVALGHALHNAGVLCRTWFHWISSAGWLGKAKINGLKSWRKKKKFEVSVVNVRRSQLLVSVGWWKALQQRQKAPGNSFHH